MRNLANIVAILLVLWLVLPKDSIIPTPVMGKGVMIIEEDRTKRTQLSPDKLAALSAPTIKKWCEDHNLPFRSLSSKDDLQNLENEWMPLWEAGIKFGKFPVLVAADKSAKVTELVSIDHAIQVLKSTQ